MRQKIISGFLILAVSVAAANAQNSAQKGNAAFEQGQFSQAIEHYQIALKGHKSAAVYINLGHAYAGLERWPEAVRAYETALALEDRKISSADILGYLGQAEYKRQNYKQALLHLGKAKNEKPSGTYSLLITRCLIDLGRFNLAEDEMMEYMKIKPDDIPAGELLAYIFRQTDRPKEAAELYKDLLRQHPTEIRYFQALAQAEIAAGHNDRAIDTLEMARRIAGSAERDLDRLLADLYIQEKMYREAASCYCRVARSNADFTAEDYYRLGYSYFQSRQWLSARQAFGNVLEREPSHARSALYLGHIAAKKGEADQAVEAYSRAARIDADWAEPYLSLAELRMKQGDFSQAAHYYRQALARQELGPTVYYRCLLALQQIEPIEKVIHILKEALNKYPQDKRFHNLLDHIVRESER